MNPDEYGLGLFSDIIWFVTVFSISIVSAFIILYILRKVRKHDLEKRVKYLFWITIFVFAFFYWWMTKYDSDPRHVPIDSWWYKDSNEHFLKQDSMEIMGNVFTKPNNTVEYVYSSVDSMKVGSYIWLNNKKVFYYLHHHFFFLLTDLIILFRFA